MQDLNLKNCSSLESLHKILVKDQPAFKVEVGHFGGRHFKLIQGKETQAFRLNDVVKCLRNVEKNPKNPSDAFYVYNLRKIISELDSKGTEELSKKNVFLRILTAVKSWVGGIGFSRKKAIETIGKEFAQHPPQVNFNAHQKAVIRFFEHSPIKTTLYDLLYVTVQKKLTTAESVYQELYQLFYQDKFENVEEMKKNLLANPQEFMQTLIESDETQEFFVELEKNYKMALSEITKMDLSLSIDALLKKDPKNTMSYLLMQLIDDDVSASTNNPLLNLLREDYVWPSNSQRDIFNFYSHENNTVGLLKVFDELFDKAIDASDSEEDSHSVSHETSFRSFRGIESEESEEEEEDSDIDSSASY